MQLTAAAPLQASEVQPDGGCRENVARRLGAVPYLFTHGQQLFPDSSEPYSEAPFGSPLPLTPERAKRRATPRLVSSAASAISPCLECERQRLTL
jgi:hypothetical protein